MAHHLPPGLEDVDEFDQAQMLSGLLHPFTGLDHLLLALAVGWIAFAVGRRAAVGLVSSFAGSMAIGMAAGRLGINLPMLEQGLALSVIAAGLVIAFAAKQARWSGMLFALIAGFWHGNAHGVEMPASVSAVVTGGAMLLGTVALSAVGAGLHAMCAERQEPIGRWVGAALAVAGAWFWIA